MAPPKMGNTPNRLIAPLTRLAIASLLLRASSRGGVLRADIGTPAATDSLSF